MNVPKNYDTADAQTGMTEYPQAGAQILRCMAIEETTSKAGNPMLVFDFDISRGKFKGFYQKMFHESTREHKKWPLKYYQLVTEENIGRYKGVIQSFQKSNPNFPATDFQGEEHNVKSLIGLEIGSVMQEEEYEKSDGSIGSILKIFYLCSIDTASNPNISIPKKRCLKTGNGEQKPKEEKMPWE